MNDHIDDKIGERGWVVVDKEATTAYLKKLARQLGQNLATATTENLEEDMKAIYSAMVDIHDMLQDLKKGGEAWRIEICDMADSGLNIVELKAKGE